LQMKENFSTAAAAEYASMQVPVVSACMQVLHLI
jgi:hypothetical protein